MSNTRNMTADQLWKRHDNKLISDLIDTNIIAIKDKIKLAHKNGLSSITYLLPIVVQMPNISYDEAKIILYSQIIERMKEDKFEVKIKNEGEDTKLLVSWRSIVDPSEIQKMQKIINDHLI